MGSLTGSGVSNSGATVNVTTEGTSDWAIYTTGGTPTNRKSGGGSQISVVVGIPGGVVNTFTGDSRTYTYTDGVSPGSGSTNDGIYSDLPFVDLTDGLQFTVPADTTARIVKIHTGGFQGHLNITATLSDGSATPYSDSTFSNVGGSYDIVYTLNYAANSTSQTLTVQVQTTAADHGNNANVILQAVTLQTSGGSSANLTGQTATFSEGSPTHSVAYVATGQTATFTEGTITRAVANAVAGQTATFSIGTLTPAISYAVTGQTASFTEGTITPSQGTFANLTGQTATFSVGTLTPSITYALTGQTATLTEGAIGPQVAYGLTGQSSTFSEGSPTPALAYAVTGLTASFTEGIISAQAGGDITRSLTGLSASFAIGIITATGGDQPVTADTHDQLPKRRKRQFDDGAQTQVIRESQLRPKKAKNPLTAPVIEIREVIDYPEDEDELLALLQDQDEQLISTIELATHLLRTLH